MRARRLALAILATAAGLASAARGNGAFPDEFSVNFVPGAPHRILIGANFGLLVSEDDGATWRYSCEPYVTTGSSAALSSANVGFYQVTANGAILADAIQVTRSPDTGCSWPMSTGSVAPPVVVSDVFADPADATVAWAITARANGSDVVASHDGGQSFGAPLYSTSDLLTGVESSKSKAGVVYATLVAAAATGSKLLRSADAGATWTATAIANTNTLPRILTVDPANENVVYLRLVDFPNDSILVTTNGGQTFGTALVATGQLTSFLLASDGALYAGTLDGHFYARPAGAAQFTQHAGPHLRCLGQRPGTARIFACGDLNLDGFSLAYSDDAGQTFQKVMTFRDLLGPLACPQVQAACAAHWSRIQQVLGIGGTGSPDAGSTGGSKAGKSGCATGGTGGLGFLALALALTSRARRNWAFDNKKPASLRIRARTCLVEHDGIEPSTSAMPFPNHRGVPGRLALRSAPQERPYFGILATTMGT